MNRTSLIATGLFVLLADCLGIAIWPSGPFVTMNRYDATDKATRAAGQRPCDVCGRPGNARSWMATGAGGNRSGTSVECDRHKSMSSMFTIGQATLTRFALGAIAVGSCVFYLVPMIQKRNETQRRRTEMLRNLGAWQAAFWVGCLLLNLMTG